MIAIQYSINCYDQLLAPLLPSNTTIIYTLYTLSELLWTLVVVTG